MREGVSRAACPLRPTRTERNSCLKQLLRPSPRPPSCLPSPPRGILWKGDFETGNTSQWTRDQSVASSRLQVVTDVVRDGKYALKAVVKQGDDPISASGNRNELLYLTHETHGKEYFYKWSTLFPNNYPVRDSWQVFPQWHQEGCCGSPPLEFFVRGEKITCAWAATPGLLLADVHGPRQWHDFVLHVKWSADTQGRLRGAVPQRQAGAAEDLRGQPVRKEPELPEVGAVPRRRHQARRRPSTTTASPWPRRWRT